MPDTGFTISGDSVKEANDAVYSDLEKDYEDLGELLSPNFCAKFGGYKT